MMHQQFSPDEQPAARLTPPVTSFEPGYAAPYQPARHAAEQPQTLEARSSKTWAIVAAAGAAAVIASFLPWASVTAPFVGSYSMSGIDGGDGWITAGVGALLVVYGLLLRTRRLPTAVSVVAGLGGLGISGLAAWSIRELQQRVAAMRAEATLSAAEDEFGFGAALADAVQFRIGVGLWILSIVGVVAAAAIANDILRRRKV